MAIRPEPIVFEDNLTFDFYQKTRKKILLFGLLINFLLTFCFVVFIYFFITKDVTILSIFIFSIIFSGLFLTHILTKLAMSPFNKILESIISFNGVQKNVQNNLSYKQNLDEIVKIVIELKAKCLTKKQNKMVSPIEGTETFRIIALDANLNIVYRNNDITDILIKNHLNFNYDGQINIYDWIKKSQKESIRSNFNWEGLQIIDNNQKKWFNVFADFQKGRPHETILLIIDQTKNFVPQQKAFEFISFAAHEMRGPITVIRGYLDILNSQDTSSGEKELIIERLISSSNRLNSYVNNILKVARLDQNNLKLDTKPIKITDVIRDIYDDLLIRAKTQSRIVEFKIEDNLPLINGEKSSLSQVFTNIIDNAIKYSYVNGKIEIRIFQMDGFVNVEIQDHGVGMPSNVMNNLFKRFYRSYRSQDTINGTGIGLFISKTIIEAHNGQIIVDSKYQKGSTFTVKLPIYSDDHDQKPTNNLITNEAWITNHHKTKR